MNKICSVCGAEKDISEFRFRADKNVYMTYCRVCERNKNKQYKKENNKKISEYNRQYMKEYNKQYYQENREELIDYQSEYRLNNPDKIKERDKKYYNDNRGKIIQNSIKNKKKRRENDPIFRLREAVSSYIRMFINKNGKSILKYFPYTIEELKRHIESQFEPWMNWDNHGVYDSLTWDDNDPATWTWQLDHIVPHSTFNYTSMEDLSFQECWSLKNLRPYSAKQNIIDGNRR